MQDKLATQPLVLTEGRAKPNYNCALNNATSVVKLVKFTALLKWITISQGGPR